MSYEIYYERGFIRVGDKFIPIVNQGSSNCYSYSFSGREVPEKGWQVLNYRNRAKLLYTEDEIREIAADYERISQESGMCFKSRNRPFDNGAFERWILCGLKSAYTIEEYVSFGNNLYISDYTREPKKRHAFKTTDEFLRLLDELEGSRELNVHFSYSRSLFRPKRKRKKQKRNAYHTMPEYYVLGTSIGDRKEKVYFSSLTRNGFKHVQTSRTHWVKAFPTEKDANKYLHKYGSRLEALAVFTVEMVMNKTSATS